MNLFILLLSVSLAISKTVIIEPKSGKATSSYIFLHGLGDTGHGVEWLADGLK
jgi:hypothetical protein